MRARKNVRTSSKGIQGMQKVDSGEGRCHSSEERVLQASWSVACSAATARSLAVVVQLAAWSPWEWSLHVEGGESTAQSFTEHAKKILVDHCRSTEDTLTQWMFRNPSSKELIDCLQVELNCNKIFGMCWFVTAFSLWISCNWFMIMWTLTDLGKVWCQRELEEADCQLLKEKLIEITLPRWMWRSLDCPLDLRRWSWLLLVTETEYNIVIFDALFWSLLCWLMHWSLGSRVTEDCIICTLHHVWWALFSWLQTVFITALQGKIDHCMHVQVCDTDSLNQCQGEVLRYMHCTHTTAHSTVLSSILTAWLKSLCKKPDWVLTGLTRIAHC